MRVLVLAPAVLVVGAGRRVVVAGDSRDAALANERHGFVRPRRVAHQVSKMVGRVDIRSAADIGQNSLERGQVRVDVGDEGVFHEADLPSATGSATIMSTRRCLLECRAYTTSKIRRTPDAPVAVSYTHLRAHETP